MALKKKWLKMNNTLTIVIPAKAGIQLLHHPFWIPVFAGMTELGLSKCHSFMNLIAPMKTLSSATPLHLV